MPNTQTTTTINIDDMYHSYMETTFWANTLEQTADDELISEPADYAAYYGWITRKQRDAIREHCQQFATAAAKYLDVKPITAAHLGQNLALSGQQHGAGFFDIDHPHNTELQNLAESFGSHIIELTMHGEMYITGGNL